ARLFNDKQVALLKTFADQAVIAIENARLFDAEQASKRELQQSLDYQTATSDVLNVISRSPNDMQPGLDTIATTAATLCGSLDAAVFLRENDDLRLAATNGAMPADFVKNPVERGWVAGRTVVDQIPVHVHDLSAARVEFPLGSELAARL